MSYELANYLLASLPADERAETLASLRRANAAEFRRMRASVLGKIPKTPNGERLTRAAELNDLV